MALKCVAEKFVLNLQAHLVREIQEIRARQILEKEVNGKSEPGAERKAVAVEVVTVADRVVVEAQEEVAVAEAEMEAVEKKEDIKRYPYLIVGGHLKKWPLVICRVLINFFHLIFIFLYKLIEFLSNKIIIRTIKGYALVSNFYIINQRL